MLQLDGTQPGDGVKAERFPGPTGRLTGPMMELQTLQEALKVEIQVHQKLVAQMKQDPQNSDLKKQLHELQAKITALSEKQKKVVEQLRKNLLVKQEPEAKVLQVQPAADKHHILQIPSPQALQAPPTPALTLQAPPTPALTLQAPPSQTLVLPAPPTQTLGLQAPPTQTLGLQAPPTQTLALQAPPTQTLALQQKTLTVTPVITTKTLPLVLKAASLPASLVPQRPTIAMVTAIGTASMPADSQNTPINLQVASKLTNQGSEPVRLVSKNAIAVQATPTTTTTTTSSTQPIKVPQFVPPPRLTPRPTFQPQVRPKPSTPNNVPIAPAPPPPMMAAPQLLQRPVMLTTKLSASSLTSAAGPIHQVRIVNGQPCAAAAKSQPSGPVAGIVITAPAAAARLASPTQTLQISGLVSDAKLRTMTVKTHGGSEQKLLVSTSTSTPPLSPAPRSKREENPQKLAFMVSLGLVTHDHLEEIQSRRQERKRRTTANPVYSGAMFEPERKKSAVTYLNTPLHQGTRKRGRPPKYSGAPELGSHTPTSPSSCHPGSPAPRRPDTGGFPFPVHPHTLPPPSPSAGDGDIHEDFCTVCRRSGQLLMCDTCSRVYHLDCLDPPLKTIPKGMWICPKCQDQILKKEEAIPWPGTLAIVHSYIAYKEAKEEEKQKLMKWSVELKVERELLEQRVKQLSNSITKCMETKNTILARQKEMHGSLEKVKHLVRLIQAFNFTQQALEKDDTDAVAGDAGVDQRAAGEPPSEVAAEVAGEPTDEAKAEAAVAPQGDGGFEAREKNEAEVEADAEMEAADVGVEAATAVAAVVSAAAEAPAAGVGAVQPETEVCGGEEAAEAEPGDAVAVEKPEDAAVATTNGHASDLAGSDAGGKEESCADAANADSENDVPVATTAAANSTEEASADEEHDKNTNNGSSTNNSKTSEPSQHSLPAILNSSDDKE